MQAKAAVAPTRVLYIEDDQDTREMVTFFLTDAKYDVVVCGSYAAALRAAKDFRFGLYIIDHELPDGHGFDLCKEIRKFDAKTPVIFCSGYIDDEHQQMALSSGAQAYLPKPFNPSELLDLMMNTIRRYVARP